MAVMTDCTTPTSRPARIAPGRLPRPRTSATSAPRIRPPLPAAETPIPAAATLPSPTPLQTPAVADPRTGERLERVPFEAGDFAAAYAFLEAGR